jgi:hypothetical protein
MNEGFLEKKCVCSAGIGLPAIPVRWCQFLGLCVVFCNEDVRRKSGRRMELCRPVAPENGKGIGDGVL